MKLETLLRYGTRGFKMAHGKGKQHAADIGGGALGGAVAGAAAGVAARAALHIERFAALAVLGAVVFGAVVHAADRRAVP